MSSRIWIATLSLLLCLSLWLPRAVAQRAALLSTPPPPGLVAWYWASAGLAQGRLWYDLLGRSHGTLTNMDTTGATSGWQASPSRAGGPYHLRLDGIDDYVALAPPAALQGGRYTIALWVDSPGGAASFVADFSSNFGANRLILSLMGGNWGGATEAITLSVNGTPMNLGAPNSVPATGWQHIAVTLDAPAGVSTGYVNCRATGTGTYTDTFAGAVSGPFQVGTRNTANGQWFTGALKDLRLYTGVARPAQLCHMMREGPGPPAETPLMSVLAAAAGAAPHFFPFFP